jgi:hypothetical protein
VEEPAAVEMEELLPTVSTARLILEAEQAAVVKLE